jgi:hypothetical protein
VESIDMTTTKIEYFVESIHFNSLEEAQEYQTLKGMKLIITKKTIIEEEI